MPASFSVTGAELGIDESAAPTLGEILAVRAERIADLRAYLAEVTQEELDRVRGPNTAIGCPPPARRTAAGVPASHLQRRVGARAVRQP